MQRKLIGRALLALCLCFSAAPAQDEQDEPIRTELVERVRSRLVQVDEHARQRLNLLGLGRCDPLVSAHDPIRPPVDDHRLDDAELRHGTTQRHEVVFRDRARIVRSRHGCQPGGV